MIAVYHYIHKQWILLSYQRACILRINPLPSPSHLVSFLLPSPYLHPLPPPVLLAGLQGRELKGNEVSGNLCVRKPWPGMARTIYGDHERFLDTYYRPYPGKRSTSSSLVPRHSEKLEGAFEFYQVATPHLACINTPSLSPPLSLPLSYPSSLPSSLLPPSLGLYFSGDGGHRDADGHYQITGRVDDVINVKGHRIGTADLESCMVSYNQVYLFSSLKPISHTQNCAHTHTHTHTHIHAHIHTHAGPRS